MKLVAKYALALAALSLTPVALADKFDACPDPAAARDYVKACMQENPYNTREACEERALQKLCSGN